MKTRTETADDNTPREAINVNIEPSWKDVLMPEFAKDYFAALVSFVKDEYKEHRVYPSGSMIFRAFWSTPFDKTKVVILGQDPYHGPRQANGLCFAVPQGVAHPPSLQNILLEAANDLTLSGQDFSGDLSSWARQGVLLLNTILTVRAQQPGSHRGAGWERFTDALIELLSAKKEHLVFLLWGAYAQQKAQLIDASKHCVLRAAHPSPYSCDRGFFGCKHFSKTNQFLRQHGLATICWHTNPSS